MLLIFWVRNASIEFNWLWCAPLHKPCVIKMLNNLRISPADIRFVFASFTPSLIELLYPFFCVCVCGFPNYRSVNAFFLYTHECLCHKIWHISGNLVEMFNMVFTCVLCKYAFYVKVSSLKYRIVFLYDSSDFKIKTVDTVTSKYLA